MEQIKIRVSQGADWPDLERIFYSNRFEGIEWLNPNRSKDDLSKQSEGERILVAESCGKVFGFIAVWEPDNFIHHLYIDLDYQGKGIGRKLVLEVRRRYPGPLRLKCGERNKKALEFYFGSGWKEVDRGESDDGPYLLLELHMAEQAAGGDATR